MTANLLSVKKKRFLTNMYQNDQILTANWIFVKKSLFLTENIILANTIVPFDRQIPFNQLPLLPPDADKIYSTEVLLALNNANKALAELKGLANQLPNQTMLINTLALREAKASTEIENIFTTDEELYENITIKKEEYYGDVKEVLYYREALWAGFNLLQKKQIITKDVLIEIYQKVKQSNDGIRPPQTRVTIKRASTDTFTGSTIYTPPNGEKVLEKKIKNLLNFINDDEKYPYDALLKMAMAHYQFEAIHPFRDGNGRTGRILNLLIMIQKNLLNYPILYHSAYIIKTKSNYYNYLQQVTAKRNWQSWLLYLLKAIETTSAYTIKIITEINQLFETNKQLINKTHPKIDKATIEKIFEQPYISPKSLLSSNIKSLNTAKKYLLQFEKLGIVNHKKIGKEVFYINVDLFNLLKSY